jgi:hypothetical protein
MIAPGFGGLSGVAFAVEFDTTSAPKMAYSSSPNALVQLSRRPLSGQQTVRCMDQLWPNQRSSRPFIVVQEMFTGKLKPLEALAQMDKQGS